VDATVRKRSSSDAVRRTRAARLLVNPINEQLGQFQIAAARLRVVGEKLARPSDEVLEEADRLARQAAEFAEQLMQALAASPRGTLEEGRVMDTIRALHSLRERVEETRQTLIRGPRN
jgi:hypothetical protein